MRLFSYDGTMEFDKLNDEQIRANYQHRHVVDQYLDAFKNKKVLDAGCWTGTMEKEVSSRKFKCEMVGIDLNKDALRVAKKNFPQYKFHQIDLFHPKPSFVQEYAGTFDTIIFLDVIEHVPNHSEVEVIKFFKKMLKPGGVLILSTMLSHRYNFIDPAWFFGHRHYGFEDLCQIILSGGLKLIEVNKIGNLYWDLDILLLYIYKHLFRRNYKTTQLMYDHILKGLNPPQKYATRLYLKATK